MAKKISLSAIQPTGNLHVGNYLGAVSNWLKFEKNYQSIHFVVDLHALTVKQGPKVLREKIREVVGLYLAFGLDPKKTILFVQSHVKEHCELSWILGCLTKMGEMERMTQFKDKAKKHADNINVGLFSYPILMAADILLYQTDVVPVGHDQSQHVELARTIAKRFNNLYGQTFKVPELALQKQGARIMALNNPNVKMSKTDSNTKSYIYLLDKPEIIKKKLASATTDSETEVRFDPAEKLAVSNLLMIYHLLSKKEIKEIEKQYQGKGYANFKAGLADVVIEFLKPLQKKYQEIIKDPKYIDSVLVDGADKAQKIAAKTLADVKNKVGLI